MLGLERVLAAETPQTAAGTTLRRHQIDALAGMLTELIAATQRSADENGNGTATAPSSSSSRRRRTRTTRTLGLVDEELEEADVRRRGPRRRAPLPLPPSRPRRARRSPPPASSRRARHLGVLILTHRRLLVDQFRRDLTTEGYGDRLTDAIERGHEPLRADPLTIQTYAWFARHADELSRDAYQLVICDEAHTALGEKTSNAIRRFPEPLYIGMTATEQLIAKQVSDVFPASVDDLPLTDAARRGLIAPLRCLRVPPVAAINSVPIVGGDFEERALAAALDHVALNQAAASLYRDRFGPTPGIVYAAGVDHAYNLAQEFRAAGLKTMAVSGRTPPRELAETLAAYERGEINVLINAQLLAEGWNSPRATVCMHLAPTASKRVYQQRIGRIMRMHPRKEAGIVVDFVPEGRRRTPSASSRSTRCSTPTSTARAHASRRRRAAARSAGPAASSRRRRGSFRSRRTSRRRLAVIQREWQRVDPKFLDDDEQRFWATIAGRQIRFDQRAEFARKFTEGRAGKGALETFLAVCAAENPNRRLRMTALADRVATTGRARRLRRSRHARHAGAAVGEGPRRRRPDPAARDRRGQGERARPDSRPLDVAARALGPQDARPQGEPGVPRGEAAARRGRQLARPPARGERRAARAGSRRRCRCRSAPRCSPRPRATRRARTRRSTRRARSSARSRRSRPRSPRTSRRRRRPRGSHAAPAQEAAAGRGCPGRATPGARATAAPTTPRPTSPTERAPDADVRGRASGRARRRALRRTRPDARWLVRTRRRAGRPCGRGPARAGSASARRRATRRSAARRPRRTTRSCRPAARAPRRRPACLGSDATASLTCVGVLLLGLVELRASRSATPSELGEPLAERLRSARARRERDVVRHRRPEAHRAELGRAARVVEHADDARRPLVARELQPELLDERGSVAAPVTGAGRVCGTSASSAPSVTTSSTPRSRASPTTRSVNARQR